MSAPEASPAVDAQLQAVLDRIADPSAQTVPLKTGAAPSTEATVVAPLIPSSPVARPWLAASASLFVWGGGQWLNRQRQLGLLFFLLQGLAAAVGWCAWRTWESWVWLGWLFFVEEVTLQTAVAVAGMLVPALGIICVVQAYLRAERRPGTSVACGPAPVPMLASILVPGWGQILNAQIGKAVLFLSAWSFGIYVVAVSRLQPGMWTRIDPSGTPIAGLALSAGALAAVALTGLAWVLAIYDASITARQNARQG